MQSCGHLTTGVSTDKVRYVPSPKTCPASPLSFYGGRAIFLIYFSLAGTGLAKVPCRHLFFLTDAPILFDNIICCHIRVPRGCFFGLILHYMYKKILYEILLPRERSIFARLTSPSKIQDFLDTFSINYEAGGETYMSPRRTLRAKTAHCFEGALVAAAAFAYHGEKPLLLDLRTTATEEDHVRALFRRN